MSPVIEVSVYCTYTITPSLCIWESVVSWPDKFCQNQSGLDKMAQWVREFTAKPGNLGSILATHMTEEDRLL